MCRTKCFFLYCIWHHQYRCYHKQWNVVINKIGWFSLYLIKFRGSNTNIFTGSVHVIVSLNQHKSAVKRYSAGTLGALLSVSDRGAIFSYTKHHNPVWTTGMSSDHHLKTEKNNNQTRTCIIYLQYRNTVFNILITSCKANYDVMLNPGHVVGFRQKPKSDLYVWLYIMKIKPSFACKWPHLKHKKDIRCAYLADTWLTGHVSITLTLFYGPSVLEPL